MMQSNFSSVKSQQVHKDVHTQGISSHHNIQIRHHLQLVFIYYSSFADRNNYHLLKHQNYRRFLIDSQIVKNTNQFPKYDILFKKISKANSNAINFQQFLKLLPELANGLYPQDSRPISFKKLIKGYIKKLQLQIRQNSQFGHDLLIIQLFLSSQPLHPSYLQLLQKLSQNCIIHKSYQIYILSTSMHQKNPSDTFQSFYRFLKQFQISPQLIYKSICYVGFKCLLMRKEQKNMFDYDAFVQMMLILAEIITRKEFVTGDNNNTIDNSNNNSNNSNNIKYRICRVLQKMQVSQGFQKISKLVKGQTYYSMSLVRLLMDQDGTLPFNQPNSQSHSNSNQKQKNKLCSLYSSNNAQKGLNASYESLNLLANQPQQYKMIKKIFQDLCGYGQVGNNKTLKSIKIKKLYTQTGLIKVISQVQLDLMITELIRKSSSGKIQFLHIVQLLNETARKLNVQQSQIYNLIINTSLQNNSTLNNITSSHIDYPQQQLSLLMQMLQTISYPLQRIFHFYSKSKNQISFEQITKMMYDFQIFPSILTKNKLYQIFIQCYQNGLDKIAQNPVFKSPDLFIKDRFSSNKKNTHNPNNGSASKYSSNYQHNNENSNEKGINPHIKQQKIMHISSFPLFLLKSSYQICQQGLKPAQKLIILIEKMHQSKGQSKVVLGKGSLVSQLRKTYPEIYKLSFGYKENRQDTQENVQDLLDSISDY